MQKTLTGLSEAEAAARRAAGKINTPPAPATRTVGEIVCGGLFTYFNLVFVLLAGALAAVGSWANMAFMGVVVCNTAVGIVQQLRSKRTIDRLTLLTAHRVRCLRGGTWRELLSDELVEDDVVEFAAGEQICADAVVLDGSAYANEALLTGEAEPVQKAAGAPLRSGSFLVAGRCTAKLTKVGTESYASRLTAEATENGQLRRKGEMVRSLDDLIRFIGLALLPLGVALVCKQRFALGTALRPSIEGTVAALVGMIPEGLYLLVSVALAAGVVRLARQRVLVQDMNCIETLARVDVLCVDKTGTITEPTMKAGEPIPLDATAQEAGEKLAQFFAALPPENETSRALAARFGVAETPWPVEAARPFTSETKSAAVRFTGHGTLLLGAPDVLAGPGVAEEGRRTVLLAEQDEAGKLRCLALFPLENPLRPAAADTFRWFAEQGVAVKVISGDSAATVSAVAGKAGIPGAENAVDLTDTTDLTAAAARCTVFGRVTPDGKRRLIRALQKQGHTVAMTGDGVNDVLALKDADCGIAMAGGAQAAAQIAQLVLLDSDFAALPAVVWQGRQVINNIQRSAALFLVKNIFSFLLAVLTLFLDRPYPFQPVQLTLVSALTIGIPSFVLALEPNRALVRGKFLPNVLRAALPGGLTDFVLLAFLQLAAGNLGLSQEATATVGTAVLLATGLAVLWNACRPFTPLHTALWCAMAVLGVAGCALLAPFLGLGELFGMATDAALLLVTLAALAPLLLKAFTRLLSHN